MGLLPIVAGLLLLAAPGALRRSARKTAPAQWTAWCAAAMATGAAVVFVSLLLLAAPLLLAVSGTRGLATECMAALGRIVPGEPVTGWIAAVAAGTTAVAGATEWRRVRRARQAQHVDAWLGDHEPYGNAELVVLPSAEPVAFCVPGTPGQIVITAGLAAQLSASELGVVLRHEEAHLAASHHRILGLASVCSAAFWWFAPARRSSEAVRLATERTADESAADTPESRAALGDALRHLVGRTVAAGTAAIAPLGTLAERLAALDGPPVAGRSLLVPAASLTTFLALGLGGAGVAAWLGEAHALVLLAGRCPLH